MVLRGENVGDEMCQNHSFSPYSPPLRVFITQKCFVRYVDITVGESKKLYAAPTRVFLIEEVAVLPLGVYPKS